MAAASALSPEELDELRQRLEARETYKAASTEERQRIQRRAELEADFPAFVRAAWHVIRPGQELKWSWHYDLIAEWLTLVYQRKCLRLDINVSPRTLKSILVTVLFPAWVWTKQPSHNFATASYSGDLSTEHSVMRRNLIESEWYKSHWGDRVWLADDQNQKTKYKNNFEAQMIATSVGGTATGLGGDTLIVDDALKADEAKSDTIRKAAIEWFDGTWRTRLNDQATGALIVVEQRTHETDLSGYLKDEGGWTHLVIPLEAEEHERWVFPISGRVVEREMGQILQPDRFPPPVVVALKKLRLVWSGQYQQRPAPLEGNMIKRADVRYYGGRDPVTGARDRDLPTKFDNVLISVDCAFKDLKTSDYVCVGAIGTSGPDRFILNVVLKHLDEPATELETLRQRTLYGARVVLVEDKANGPAVIKKLRQKIPGVIEIEPEGGKVPRMFAACGEWQSGNWYVDRNAAWTDPFVESITKFPTAKHDDDVDMMTQAAIWLMNNSQSYGLIELLKRLEQEAMAKKHGRTGPAPKKVDASVQRNTLPAETNGIGETKTAEVEKKVITGETNGHHGDAPHTEEKLGVDIPDNVDRCPECKSVLVQRVASGKRCGQCGLQWGQRMGGVPMAGLVRK